MKLKEETQELLEDKNLEEITDIMEVLFAIANKYSYSEEDVLSKRNEKKNNRGSFEDNLILKNVY